MEKNYSTSRTEADMTVAELLRDYYEPEYFEELCRRCPNYGELWSCPPYNFSPRGYLEKFSGLRLVGTLITPDPEVRRQAITAEQIRAASERMIAEVKREADGELLELERKTPGSRMLSSGGCRLCTRCARRGGLPCRLPGKMRFSLESLGCDVTRLAADRLGIELVWAKDSLPPYILLVNGFLSV